MVKAGRQSDILDRAALDAALAASAWRPGEGGKRAEALALCKGFLARGRAELESRLDAGARGGALVAGYTFLTDEILHAVYDHAASRIFAEPNPTSGARLSLIAVGGYGRAELSPHSDIDLLFLHPWKLTARNEQVVEYVLYMLWDMGLKVGQATRSINDCLARARSDMTIRTGLLESRYLCGDEALFLDLRQRFRDEIVPGSEGEFVAAKLAERDARHLRTGDSRYLVEPNIKDGKGGLRDLHTLFWIAKYLYRVDRYADLIERGLLTRKEQVRFARAEGFLWKVRAHLHLASGRAEDRLSFDLQPEIARRMGYGDRDGNLAVERFMKHYFLVAKSVGELTRVLCASLEADRLDKAPLRRGAAGPSPAADGLRTEGGRLAVADEAVFKERPARLIKLFRLAQTGGQDIHPRTLRLVHQSLPLVNRELREDDEANRLFMDILSDAEAPEIGLRMMNEAGVLGRFIPEFGRIVGQTQHDMYHVYTVDEHTVRAIGILSQIERGELAEDLPLASQIAPKILSRGVLYLALFLHDIAKGGRHDHSEAGERIVNRLGPRLGLSAEETAQAAWLVRHHLIFSDTAFKRDVNDPQTLADFIARVQSVERLRLLLVLTAADIRAVGPGRWNAWKGALLRELYHRAEEVMTGGHEAAGKAGRVAAAKGALRDTLVDWLGSEITAFTDRLFPPYWLAFDSATHARHARLVRDADSRGALLELDTRIDTQRAATEITLYAKDQPGMFSAVAGAMAAAGASIVDAKVFTTSDGMALDGFWVQDALGGPFDNQEKLARILSLLEQALTGATPLDSMVQVDGMLHGRQRLPARSRAAQVTPRVLVDNQASSQHTVSEINGRDRPGLLYDIGRALTDLGLSIVTAQISTYGAQAVDVFYVKDRYGMQVTKKADIARVRSQLLSALEAPISATITAAAE
ncbi:MAG: Bifunctional uridylyltransferase/uridylyl-removing enzyme [Alphaproteobacteria bacterium MarineAlpha10_Bin1]|nr:MAG: Bifunctional uridylyltransferase/uridylyl-removing enzyme [Alphaproteobacteria bacterium MarineAlpha10_Bin1]